MVLDTVFPPAPAPGIPVMGAKAYFPVHRIYCAKYYAAQTTTVLVSHEKEPIFYLKPAEAVTPGSMQNPAQLKYAFPPPPKEAGVLTAVLNHEVELVVAIEHGGSHIEPENALKHVYGYAVGLDGVWRDGKTGQRRLGGAWSMAKGIDLPALVGPIVPVEQLARMGHAFNLANAEMRMFVNGQLRAQGSTDDLIYSVTETIAAASKVWKLQPGDLIYVGTRKGVGAH